MSFIYPQWLNRHNFIRLYALALIVFVGGLILWAFGYLNLVSIRLQLAAIGLWLFLVIGGAVYWFKGASGGYPTKTFFEDDDDEDDWPIHSSFEDNWPRHSSFEDDWPKIIPSAEFYIWNDHNRAQDW